MVKLLTNNVRNKSVKTSVLNEKLADFEQNILSIVNEKLNLTTTQIVEKKHEKILKENVELQAALTELQMSNKQFRTQSETLTAENENYRIRETV